MKRSAARIAARVSTALFAFTLGTIAHSLWRSSTKPPNPAPTANAVQATLNQPLTFATAVTVPVATPDPHPEFGDGLKLVANEVQLKDEVLRYQVNITYPQIDGSDAVPIRKLNKHIERLVTQKYQWLLNPSKEDLRYYKKGPHPEAFNSVDLDYEVVLATDTFLSIYFEGYGYGIGAAHSVQYSFVVNYDLQSNRLLKLSDVFKPRSKYLEFVSKFCTDQLSKIPSGEYLWTSELANITRNFESWNMTDDGIRFNFDACTVFSCAAGKQTVEIPFAYLRKWLSYGQTVG